METGGRGKELNCKVFLALSLLTPDTPSLSLLLLHSLGEWTGMEKGRCLTLLLMLLPWAPQAIQIQVYLATRMWLRIHIVFLCDENCLRDIDANIFRI